MADLRPQYSEEVVGHGHPTKTDVTNRAWNVEHEEDGTHKVLPGASGIKMWFYQNTAPIGWTLDATPSDDLLAVKGGAQAYNALGGTGAGTWTVAGLTKDAHTHAQAGAAGNGATGAGSAHTHGLERKTNTEDKDTGTVPWPSENITGGEATHTHTGPSHQHGATGIQSDSGVTSDATWRAKARLGIICTKD